MEFEELDAVSCARSLPMPWMLQRDCKICELGSIIKVVLWIKIRQHVINYDVVVKGNEGRSVQFALLLESPN